MSGVGQSLSLGVSTEPGSGNEPGVIDRCACRCAHALVCRLVGAEPGGLAVHRSRCTCWCEDRTRSTSAAWYAQERDKRLGKLWRGYLNGLPCISRARLRFQGVRILRGRRARAHPIEPGHPLARNSAFVQVEPRYAILGFDANAGKADRRNRLRQAVRTQCERGDYGRRLCLHLIEIRSCSRSQGRPIVFADVEARYVILGFDAKAREVRTKEEIEHRGLSS